MKKKISIIIVTYNSENHIFDCLDSIFKYNDIGAELEIIIVDNMSKNVDQMFTTINEKYASTVKLVKNPTNGGYGQGNNVGVRLATSDIIMIMNPDVRLVQPTFKEVYNIFLRVRVDIVGFQQLISSNKRGQSFFIKETTIKSLFEGKIYSLINVFIQKKMCISGACFTIRKKTFESIGLFDENIFMYGEELDLHNRLFNYNKNSLILLEKKISYIHLVDDRVHLFNLEQRQFDSFLYLCKKNNLDINKECSKRLKLYYFLRFRSILLGRNVSVLNKTIELINNYLKNNYRG